jgi:hypothetical protein
VLKPVEKKNVFEPQVIAKNVTAANKKKDEDNGLFVDNDFGDDFDDEEEDEEEADNGVTSKNPPPKAATPNHDIFEEKPKPTTQ